MSSSENMPVQDLLRKVADCDGANIAYVLSKLQDALDIKQDGGRTWGEDVRVCLREIADRIDAQTVVEVTAPPAKPKNAVKVVQTIKCGDFDMFMFSCYHTTFSAVMPKYCPFCGRPIEGEASDE